MAALTAASLMAFAAPPETGDGRLPNGDIVKGESRRAVTPTLSPVGDPDLEPGFPVKALHLPGSYHGGPALHTLVGNIDRDPELEILVTGLAVGPLYAWNHDGSIVPGWPITRLEGAGYMVLGEFQPERPGLEVFSGHFGATIDLGLWHGNGRTFLGWPQRGANYVSTPGTAVDVDANGTDEIFVCEEDNRLHAYRSSRWPLAGWPVAWSVPGGQDCHTPAVGDLDGDGRVEIVTASGATSGGGLLLALHHDGTPVAGFPFVLPFPEVDAFPVIGDVDGDGEREIVLFTGNPTPPHITSFVLVVSAAGALERSIATPESHYGSAPALADLDGDGIPEIVVQTEEALHVWRGDGSPLPGWPRNIGPNTWMRNSAPVVGDVTGDGLPDIVLTVQPAGSLMGRVLVFDRGGDLHPHFPKILPIDSGGVPAIADIDLDGRNEIVISGSSLDGYPGLTDRVWVYDLGGGPHGPILWGQFMGGPKHQGRYPVED